MTHLHLPWPFTCKSHFWWVHRHDSFYIVSTVYEYSGAEQLTFANEMETYHNNKYSVKSCLDWISRHETFFFSEVQARYETQQTMQMVQLWIGSTGANAEHNFIWNRIFFPIVDCVPQNILKLSIVSEIEIYAIGTTVSSVAQIRANTFALSNVLKKLEW